MLLCKVLALAFLCAHHIQNMYKYIFFFFPNLNIL